jgi:molecular chaperone DnaK
LANFLLDGLLMAPAGTPRVELTYKLDANGILNCSAKDLSTGKSAHLAIRSDGGLSDSEIERMIREAELNKDADRKRKDLNELKNKCD